MVDSNNKHRNILRVEFWATTTIFVFIIINFITDGLDGASAADAPYKQHFAEEGMSYSFYTHYFVPQLIHYLFLFSAFLYLNFIVIPKLVRKEAFVVNILLVLFLFLLGGLVFGIADTYLKGYLYGKYNDRDAANQAIFQASYLYTLRLLLLFVLYTMIKYISIYLIDKSAVIEKRYSFFNRDGIVASVVWLMVLFLLITANADAPVIGGWAIIPAFGILFYWLSFYSLIPRTINKKNAFIRYIFYTILIQLILLLPVFLLGMLIIGHEGIATAQAAFSFAFHILITAPVSWYLFKRRQKGNEEVFVLKKALGRSDANLNFLRSQINPHFLFNALNTIYGTAIQEKAERTSEGIEKLGDMMRFMLQENIQEKISIAREIDYLNNFISLQKLRTDCNPNVHIQTEIQNRENIFQIAPMLLIPFVENAFKHGISLREPSHIKVSLEIKDNTLYLDVYNSKHLKQEKDPEKDKSGIGLENVKQRLKLLYPNQHELIIRETTKEFFIHLTVRLA